jgi:hypothetical protein
MILAFFSLLLGPARSQAPSPVGDPFLIPTYTTGGSASPSVAVDPSNGFVAVWQSNGSVGDDNSGRSIQAQRYAASDNPVGDQFQVNSYTTLSQEEAAIAMDGLGNFVVVWESSGSDGTDTSLRSIRARRFNAVGLSVGDDFQVNTYTSDNQTDPAVAMDVEGNFVVVWQSYGSYGTDDDYRSIQGQLFDSSGASVGGEFQINTFTTGDQRTAAVTADCQGNFIVVWEIRSYETVKGQRYDGNGAPLGGEFKVESRGYGGQPAVGADALGNFTVAWSGALAGGVDDSESSVEAQRFNTNGDPVGDQFQVNTYTTDWQEFPSIAVDSKGNMVIVWESDIEPGDHLLAQYFNASGAPMGGEFQVSTEFYGFKTNPSVGYGSGEFVVAWRGSYPPGVRGRRFYSPTMAGVFSDGFEAGNICGWGRTAP